MIQLSPRDYVFIGLEWIREPLIKFIGKTLKSNSKSWWYDYIYLKFSNKDNHIPRSGSYNDLYVYLDEALCFIVIEYNAKIFAKLIDINLIKELHKIRNDCAHKPSDGKFNKVNADDALLKMALAMQQIDKECEKKILSLRNEMNTQIYNEKEIAVSKEILVSFLKHKLWNFSIDKLTKAETIDEDFKHSIISNMEDSIKKVTEQFTTVEEIVAWYNYHLFSLEGIEMYLKLKSIKEIEIPTFEDIRLEFMQLCYPE